MKKYVLIALMGGMIWACGGDKASSNSSSAPKKVDGKKIFKTYCVVCHGLYGDMEVNGAKDLNLSILTLEERISMVTNGKNLMTPFKGVLTEEQIEAVAQYTIDNFNKK